MNPNSDCSIAITLDTELTPSQPFNTTALIPTPEGGGELGDRSTGAAGDPMTGLAHCDCCAPMSPEPTEPTEPTEPVVLDMAAPANEA